MAAKNIYKVIFLNQGKIYEVYARQVAQSAMFGFIEIEQLIFGSKTEVVIDPSEERLKEEFKEVKRTYVPMHAVIRIDEVEKEGTAKMSDVKGDAGQIVGFPGTVYGKQDTPKADK
jgi:hypothetical protein